MVTPLVGVWIEIAQIDISFTACFKSLPLWECGLKSSLDEASVLRSFVTPLVGVWIEMISMTSFAGFVNVTPLVGVWIEILYCQPKVRHFQVTPLVGVWIEISIEALYGMGDASSLPLWECGLK